VNIAAKLESIRKLCQENADNQPPRSAASLAEEILDLLDPDNDAEKASAVVALYGKIAGFEFDRPIVFLDCEATDKNPQIAKIIEVAAIKIFPDGREAERFQTLVNPLQGIPDEVRELTGITDEDIHDAPPWSQVARPFLAFVDGAYICGFGAQDYDIPLLWAECHRARENWEIELSTVLEVANLYKKMEPRTLAAAVAWYLGGNLKDAHRAMNDAEALLQVLPAMLVRYEGMIPGNFRELAGFCAYDRRLDIAGKIILNEEGVPVFNIGDQKGVPVAKNTKFSEWMLGKADFSENTKQVIRAAMRNNTINYRK
jgi:DNA polymerase III subunit epsilon